MSNPVAINTGANWKNVNNWHWIEKDCTAWAHDRIKNLLTSMSSCEGFSITKIISIEGDVSVNQRKGKVKQLFDLEINFEFKKVDGSTGTGYVSDFTADYEDPSDLNLKLSPRIEEYDNVLKALGEVVKEFKAELFEIHGKPLLLEANNDSGVTCTSSPSSSNTNTSTSTNNNTNTSADFSNISKPSTNTSAAASTVKSTTIEDEITFPCPPDQLYLMLTDPSRIRSWTRSPATLPQLLLPGAPFSLFDGNISGKFLTLTPSTNIEMEWKLRSWDRPSNVSISIKSAENGQALLKMKQSGVPSGEAQVIKDNWHNYYWNPIKRAFGVLL